MNELRRDFLPSMLTIALFSAALHAQGFAPEEALKRMKVTDGFEVKLVASEPLIRQPVTMTFDERGRLWVIQYLQYPNPAGLKPVKVDQYLRTVYDRMPEPPPKGPRGVDRITILEEPDENGRYRKAKDFVAGLNLASGLCLGNGGVYVLQVPYLLFYPDRDGDDAPDGPPEVLLSGFGMEDAHAVANSLQWGPDGWLYGAQGSTVTAKIRGIEFQQGIWRYHPRTRRFELFSEGGGNTWGLDFDEHGQVIAGTNWGGFAMLHQVQGGYYVKGFSKHGPLHNAHTYGYFEHVPYQRFKGGHVTCGGIVYQGGAYPDNFRNVYIAGNLLSNSLYWHILERKGSSFVSRFGGDFLVANDTWFRPIDCLTGPDGAVYVADWYDKRANHVDPVDNWDRTNGRVYKIASLQARSASNGQKQPVAGVPGLYRLSSKQLIALLDHPNDWQRREARRILGERRDASVLPVLRKSVLDNKGRLALESLWALYVSGGFDEAFAEKLLDHANEHVRGWTVRLLGDDKQVSTGTCERLIELARREPSTVVRSQLACSCKRLPAADALPIVRELLRHSEDIDDPHIPLLLWWAVEDKAIAHRDRVLVLLDAPDAWRLPLVKRFLLERLSRRYLAEGGKADLETCACLLEKAPGAEERELLLRGMDMALEGRLLTDAPPVLTKAIARLWRRSPDAPVLLRLAVRLGETEAYAHLLKRIADAKVPERDRAPLVELLGQVGKAESVPLLLDLFAAAKTDALRGAVFSALQPFPDTRIAERVLALYPRLSSALRARAQGLLASRPASGLALLRAVDAGRIAPRDLPFDRLQRLTTYKDERIDKLIAKHWGTIAPATAGEKISRIRSINLILSRGGKGDAANGRLLFQKNCATCHTLFGEGNKIGPDLTGADRKNREYLIAQIVDPNAVIRAEFQAFNIETKDGRSLAGLVVESAPGSVTLVDSKNERTVVARNKIEQMTPSATSLMPEKILDPLSDPELCDLFRYLQGDGLEKQR
ncbi:MAG TPA: PVC-type heme-binding CxxCH protein [Gemmataceae bacterium]|nr:PVC-type heme-binding CxxCH protein [Gemmataceae bacterium]